MSTQLLEKTDKSVSTEDVGDVADFARLEAVLSALVESKVVSIRESKKAERRRLFGRLRSRSDDSAATEPIPQIRSSRRLTHLSTSLDESAVAEAGPAGRATTPSASLEDTVVPAGRVLPQQSFDSTDAVSKHSDSCCCSKPDARKSACLPKHLSTQEWINSTSRQASTETATTSSGYISPSHRVDGELSMSQMSECTVVAVAACTQPCCCSACLPSQPPHTHLHPTGGHYVSCCNSPSHSHEGKMQYDDNYIALAINLEDLEFEQEEERRKRRKRKKKRRKERQARARGLMADELRKMKSGRVDPDDLPKRARWTIVATACLLLLMSLMLVGVTLRMAPIIDDMVRRENEEIRNSLSRHSDGATHSLPTTVIPSSSDDR